MTYSHYCQLAELFDFPGPEYIARVKSVEELLRENYRDAMVEVQHFLKGIPENSLDLQELYTRTFDVQAITTLDIGYVMFGDDYKRAELLSNLMREHNLAGTDRKGELADHLPNILRLMPKLKSQELLNELVSEILVPALVLMIREFDSGRIEKKNTNYQKHYKTLIDTVHGSDATIYCRALVALLEVLKKDFDVTGMMTRIENWAGRRQTSDFLGLIEKEMEIEQNANPVNRENLI